MAGIGIIMRFVIASFRVLVILLWRFDGSTVKAGKLLDVSDCGLTTVALPNINTPIALTLYILKISLQTNPPPNAKTRRGLVAFGHLYRMHGRYCV